MLGVPRVMGDSTLLPNGKVLLHGGAQVTEARAGGWGGMAGRERQEEIGTWPEPSYANS